MGGGFLRGVKEKDCCWLGFLIFLGAYLFAVFGCASSSRQVPESGAPVTLQAPLEIPQRESSPLMQQGALTLERAIEEALKASPELEQMSLRIEAAAEQVKQAEASFYPRLILSEDYNVTNNPVYALMYIINQRRLDPTVNFNDPGRQQNFSSKVQGEWLLFEGGSRWFDRKAAVARRRSAEAELRSGRNQLVAKVTETYLRWLNALGFIAVAERALESARTDERLGQARLEAQAALPSELSRLRVRTAEARDNLVSARTGARKLQAALERLMARAVRPDEVPDPAAIASSRSIEAGTQDPDALVRTALDRRPEMAAVASMIEAAKARVKSARGGFLPRIGANAFYEWDSRDFIWSDDTRTLIDPNSDKLAAPLTLKEAGESWMFGVQASWPIFEGGVTLSMVREAQSRLRELEAKGRQVALDIALEVHQAALTVQEAEEKLRVAEERRNWAEKALKEVQHLYRSQVVTVDSLLQAEVAWNQAEVSYTSASFEAIIARAVLRQSLGDFAEGITMEKYDD